jgi:hypothetical protein
MALIDMSRSDFKEFVTAGSIYLDKTLFIKDFIEKSSKINLYNKSKKIF